MADPVNADRDIEQVYIQFWYYLSEYKYNWDLYIECLICVLDFHEQSIAEKKVKEIISSPVVESDIALATASVESCEIKSPQGQNYKTKIWHS